MIKKMNKVGGTYSGWVEIVLIVVLFSAVLLIVGSNFNSMYGKSNDYSFGIATNDTLKSLQDYQGSLATDVTEGQSSLTSFGIFLVSTLPKMIIGVNGLLWNFVSGSFINHVVELMNLGEYSYIIIIVLRLLYFLAIGFIFLKIITKVLM